MIHFLVEESFLNKYLATFFEYTSWDVNIVVFFLCRALLTVYIMNHENYFKKAMHAKQKRLYTDRDSLELFLKCQFSLISL